MSLFRYKEESLNQEAYWDEQFKESACIWGNRPSITADIALSHFKENQVHSILIPGVGYGRNSKLFTSNGFDVTGVEISSTACNLARNYDPRINLFHGSIFDVELPEEKYDAIFCFDVLHLFLEKERSRFIDKCSRFVRPNGFMFFTALSENDDYFGCGTEVEAATFEVKAGKYIHFFTELDLTNSFRQFTKLEGGQVIDSVSHAKHGQKAYEVRYIFVQKC